MDRFCLNLYYVLNKQPHVSQSRHKDKKNSFFLELILFISLDFGSYDSFV